MRELAGRLAELDPDAGAALQAIAYFDRLMEGRVGLEALVRGAAVLSGHPARLVDERRGVRIRVEPDGRREDAGGPVDPAWPWAPLDASEVGRPWAAPVTPGVAQERVPPAARDAPHAAPPRVPLGSSGVSRPRGRKGAPETAPASALEGTRAAPASVAVDATHAASPPVSPATSAETGPRGQAGTPEAAPASLASSSSPPPPVPLGTSGATQPSATVGSPTAVTHADVGVPEIGAALWLELPGPPDGVRAMILERAAGAVRAVLERTRGWAPPAAPAPDPALVEVVLDASAPDATRTSAAAQLGLKRGQSVRAVALQGGGAEIVPAGRPETEARRAGVGPAVEPAELPRSWAAARTALRLTAEGTAHDPGPRTVYADELGGLALLAEAVGPDTPPIPDEHALERALAEASWAAATLHAVASAPSLRAAAAELTVHHSTLQERLVQAEHILGWDVHSPQGRLRLQLVLAVRKLRRSGAAGQSTGGFSGGARQ
ncbi:helix-turn-helix domain-containing protein [Streptomyces sp. NPDC005808]|uniref:helix-turn-helix domain-containing protein n=1 Tax=Streptomyces sp. NPDC005808 TaxID=3364734 RepID=UPI0036BB73C9